MADILIRGMEMPTNRDVTVRIDPAGEVYVYDTYPTLLLRAVTLPEGHKDLIERKRLDLVPDYKDVRNGIKRIVKETKRDGRAVAGISIELLEQTIIALDELRAVRRYFENAKTIVPADGSKTE